MGGEVRGGALKLGMLLLPVEGFRATFLAAGGLDAVRASAELEPPEPPMPFAPRIGMPVAPGSLSGKAPAANKIQFCNPGCDAACCFGGIPGLSIQRPRSRREIANQLLLELVVQ